MTQNDDQRGHLPASEDEISNVDLQFMGRTDVERELTQDEKAEARLADEYADRGLDPQDVASAGSMVASDPASTHMHPDDTES